MLIKILLITVGQPSTNPRIVKEADALQSAGFTVTLLYCSIIDWAIDADKNLLKKVSWNYKMIGGTPLQNKKLYFFTKMRFKFARLMNKIFGNKMLLAERAQSRAYDELLEEAKNIKADWYIGHNLGALSIVVNAAKYHHAKAGFDFEDYHRGEYDNLSKSTLSRIIYLENKYVPALNYISAASPMIADKITANFPENKNNIIILLNCFPLKQQPAFRDKAANDKTLQLFWFSQTVGLNRGLEIIIEAFLQMKNKNIHLTLAGRCNQDLKEYIDKIAFSIKDQIHFAGIIEPNELPSFSSQFDVGLALETGFSENNSIALSNKIFTYLLAGNAIIISETAMQANFNEIHNIGKSFKIGDLQGLISAIESYKNLNILNKQRAYNYELAKNDLNWKEESVKFLLAINKN